VRTDQGQMCMLHHHLKPLLAWTGGRERERAGGGGGERERVEHGEISERDTYGYSHTHTLTHAHICTYPPLTHRRHTHTPTQTRILLQSLTHTTCSKPWSRDSGYG
jgi:hypothetical protein